MIRTILITGAASGIGQATARLCEAAGHRVIEVDLANAEIETDLSTREGREKLIAEAHRLAPDGLDAVVACAGIARQEIPRTLIAVNYFGAVATLEGLRPLLAKTERPRAVAICSTAVMLPINDAVIESCLAGNETEALNHTESAPLTSYSDSKRALALWLRRTAGRPEWAGSGILLNGVAPGVVETPMTAPMNSDPEWAAAVARTNPIAVKGYAQPDEIAELILFLTGFRNHYLVGQVIYIDGGTDIILRPDVL